MPFVDSSSQNVILNAGNFIGRIIAGFIASYCGISNAFVGSTLGFATVTFAMISLSTRAGATCIGLFIGFFLGVCQYPLFFSRLLRG